MDAALRFVFVVSLSCLTHIVSSQGPAQLTFSSNPVCSGENVTLTLTYTSPFQLSKLTVDAFNGTLKKGFLFYQALPANSTGIGVFAGKNFNGWPTIPASAAAFSVTLTAMPLLELDYNSSAVVYDSVANSGLTLTSTPVRLLVDISPSPPRFLLSSIVFNDSDSGIIVCESRNGKPAAAVLLTVSHTSGGPPAIASGVHSASMNLSSLDLPLSKWHNAMATCRVTNHNCAHLNVTSDHVRINYVANTSVPDVIYRNESVVLNCSTYISYYPGVQYNWTTPPAANVTSSLYLEWLTVPQGQIGSFYCTATNNVTMASVVIVFTLGNLSRPSTTQFQDTATCGLCWIMGPVLGIIAVIIAVVFSVLCKRGSFPKGRKSTSGSEMHHPDVRVTERRNASKRHSVVREYDSLDIQRSSEPTYSELVLEQNSNSTTLYENFKSPKI